MHFFKWVGVVALLATGVLTSLCLRSFERHRITQAQNFLALVRFLRWQIDTLAKPLPAILADLDEGVLYACGWGAETRPKNLSDLLAGCTLYLSEEMCTLLYDFAKGLGTAYREEQLRGCDYILSRLAPYTDALCKDLPKREKAALFLPIAGALALILLLI